MADENAPKAAEPKSIEVHLTELHDAVKSLTDSVARLEKARAACVECSCGPCAECTVCHVCVSCHVCVVCRTCRICRQCNQCFECTGCGPCAT